MGEGKATSELSQLLRHARLRCGFSAREVAKRAGVNVSNVVRLEQGSTLDPRPATLKAISAALELDLADAYAAAGYMHAGGLPSFAPYLRSRYGRLPRDVRNELERSFDRLARKYGYDAFGPAPGQDEH